MYDDWVEIQTENLIKRKADVQLGTQNTIKQNFPNTTKQAQQRPINIESENIPLSLSRNPLFSFWVPEADFFPFKSRRGQEVKVIKRPSVEALSSSL